MQHQHGSTGKTGRPQNIYSMQQPLVSTQPQFEEGCTFCLHLTYNLLEASWRRPSGYFTWPANFFAERPDTILPHVSYILCSIALRIWYKAHHSLFTLVLVVCQRDQTGNGKVTTELCQAVAQIQNSLMNIQSRSTHCWLDYITQVNICLVAAERQGMLKVRWWCIRRDLLHPLTGMVPLYRVSIRKHLIAFQWAGAAPA